MGEDHQATKAISTKELEFDDAALESATISDKDIEEVDAKKQIAKKRAKKVAKAYRSPREKRIARLKKVGIVILVGVVLIGVVLAIPQSRWSVLNAAGLRNTITIEVIEEKTKEPVINAEVTISSGGTVVTDEKGRASLSGVEHGKFTVTIAKQGYSKITTGIVSDFRSNDGGTYTLKIIGFKMAVSVKDWLSQQQLSGATVSSGEFSAKTDKDGVANLIVLPSDDPSYEIAVSAPGFNEKKIEVEQGVRSTETSLLPSAKNYFISNRDRKYDIYASNIDGSGQRKVIEATGKESVQLLEFTIHRDNKKAVLVANRDGLQRNGQIIAGVYVVDLEKSTLQKVDEGSNLRMLGWAGDALVYHKTNPDLKFDNPNLTQIRTVNATTGQINQIAQSNYFSALGVGASKVFYMPSDAYRTLDDASFSSFDVTTGARQTYLDGMEVGYITNPSFGVMELQTADGSNIELVASTGATRIIDRPPGTGRSFMTSSDGKRVMWTDRRDGRGALVLRNLESGEERVVAHIGGMVEPIRFVSGSIAVVRVASSEETADYAVHLGSGKYVKIVDVANVGSIWSD